MNTPTEHAPAPTNGTLFRPEVLVARGSQWIGEISLVQPAAGWLVATVALVLSICTVSFITFGSMTRKERVTGLTVPRAGSLTILAGGAGILVQQFVKEGQFVSAGQALFEVSSERHGETGDLTALLDQQLAVRLEAIGAERRVRIAQDHEKRQAFDVRLINLVGEGEEIEHEIALVRRRKALAELSLRNFQQLQASGFVSATQTQQKQEDSIDQDSRLATLARTKVQLEGNVLSLRAERSALDGELTALLAQLARTEASLKQEIVDNHDRGRTRVTAPEEGRLTTIALSRGQAVAAGQVLGTLIPSSQGGATAPLEVVLYAPSRTAGFVAAGQKVRIRYQAYPYQKFGLQEGTVRDVSATPFAPNELAPNVASTILTNAQQNILGFNGNEALYRIRVELAEQSIKAYGKTQMLKPGLTLEADILQEDRKIWEWIFEPLLAVTRR